MRSADYWSVARGRPEAPTPPVRLSAGDASVVLDGGDIRYYTVAGTELLRRVYVAVRNVAWETLPAVVTDVRVEEADGGVRASYEAHVLDEVMAFSWAGVVELSASGELTYSMSGEAGSSFDYARIGLCALHPPWLEGRPYRLETAAGVRKGSFPTGVAPQPFVEGEYYPVLPAFSSLDVIVREGAVAEFRFSGDEFENEDQRNWSDASYKSYSTPMSLGILHADPGSRIAQAVRVRLRDAGPTSAVPGGAAEDEPIELTLESGSGGTFPEVGLGWPAAAGVLQPAEVAVLRRLHLAHLRVDVRLCEPGSVGLAEAADGAALGCGCGLELAAFASTGSREELDLLGTMTTGLRSPLRRVLAFSEAELVSSAATVAAARGAVAGIVAVYGGTNLNFAEINRDRPDPATAEGFTFSSNPQVHMADDRSLTETPASLADMLRTARGFLGDRPIALSPLTLLPRFNADAPGAGTVGLDDPPTDGREATVLCAAFTALALKHLAAGGATAVTLLEAVGERGVVARAGAPVRVGGLEVPPGAAFPVAELLSVIGRWSGRPALRLTSRRPLSVDALGCVVDGRTEVLVANATAEEQVVELPLPATAEQQASVARLDADSVATAWTGGGAASAWTEPVDRPLGGVIELPPYGLALVSW